MPSSELTVNSSSTSQKYIIYPLTHCDWRTHQPIRMLFSFCVFSPFFSFCCLMNFWELVYGNSGPQVIATPCQGRQPKHIMKRRNMSEPITVLLFQPSTTGGQSGNTPESSGTSPPPSLPPSQSNENLSAHSLTCVLLTNCYSDWSTLKWISVAPPLKVNPHPERLQLEPREVSSPLPFSDWVFQVDLLEDFLIGWNKTLFFRPGHTILTLNKFQWCAKQACVRPEERMEGALLSDRIYCNRLMVWTQPRCFGIAAVFIAAILPSALPISSGEGCKQCVSLCVRLRHGRTAERA